MAKAKKTKPEGDKSPKEASNLFHNIIKASVKTAPTRQKNKNDKPQISIEVMRDLLCVKSNEDKGIVFAYLETMEDKKRLSEILKHLTEFNQSFFEAVQIASSRLRDLSK